MDFQIFMNTIKSVTAIPEDPINNNLMNAVMFADSGVQKTFFSDKQLDTYLNYKREEVDSKFSDLAVIYLSFVIGCTSSFDFNKTVNVKSNVGVTQWFKLYSSSVGRYMAADYLRWLTRNNNAGILNNPAGAAQEIADATASDRFCTDFLVECNTLGSTVPVIAFLTLLESIDEGGKQLDRVLSVWEKNTMWSKIPDYKSYNWLDASAKYFDLNNTGFNNVAAAVLTAVAKTSTTQSSKTSAGAGGMAYTHAVTTTIYGQDVLSWLYSANGPVRFNNLSGQYPSNTSGGTSGGGRGCMIAGTSILTAGEMHRPIESIMEFDRVVSAGGSISTCSGEMLTSKSMTDLYSVNEDAPFMSLEHVVMTQRGWCSLHPALSQQLNPGLQILHLQEGDLIWKVLHIKKGKIKYATVPVNRINIARYKMGEAPLGYVFHLKDGHNTYHANGYCCLSGYPQITTQFIAANILSNMTPSEQLHFKTGLDDFSPLLEKAIGQGPVEAIKNILKDPVKAASSASHTNIHGVIKKVNDYRELIVPSMIVQPRSGSKSLPPDLNNLAIIRGQLFINGNPVESCVKNNHICWQRKNKGKESGMVRLHHNGLLGEGIITNGKVRTLFTAAAMIDYTTSYTNSTSNISWVGFEMGFEPGTDGSMHPVGQLVIQNDAKKTAELEKHSTVAYSIDSSGSTELHADIEFDADYCSFGGSEFIAAEFNFSMDYTTFTGTLFEYDSSASDNRGAGHALSGVCTTSVSGMLAKFTAFIAKKNPDLSLLQPQATFIKSSLQEAVALTTADDLSVNALFTLPTPDMQNVHQLAFSKLKSLMLYAMDESWLTWFNQTKPVIGSEISLADAALLLDTDINTFLATQFPIGYLTQAFSQSDDPNIKSKFDNMIGWGNKLLYFWKGADADTCFAKSKGYNKAMNSLLSSAFTDSVPGFDAYLQDSPANWALQLYNHCTTPATLLGLAVQTSVDARARLTQLSTMLQALDATTLVTTGSNTKLTYAQALYQRVIDMNLNKVLTNSVTADNTVIQDFLTEFFRQYFNSLISGGPWTDDVLASAKADMNTLMEEFGATNAAELVDSMNKVITGAVTIMATDAFKNLPVAARIQKWVTDNPNAVKNIGKIGTVLTIAVYGFAYYQTITTLMKWDELTPAQKAQAVTNLMDTTASIFNDFSKYKAAQTISTPDSDTDDLIDASTVISDEMEEGSMIELTTIVGDANGKIDAGVSVIEEAGAELGIAVQETGDIAQVASRWTQIAKITDVAAKGITVVALAASCVVGGFDISNDFKEGQPASLKSLDILEEAANGVAFLAVGGEGIAALAGIEVCSAIPVIGAVAAIAGVVFAFTEMFIHRNPPPTAEETFVDDQSAVFLGMLPLPPQAWLDKQANLDKHLNTAG